MARIDVNSGLLVISGDEDGSRLDRVIMRIAGEEKRPLIQRLIRQGNVRVNKKRAKPDTRLHKGDTVFLPASLRPGSRQGDDKRAEPAGISPALLKRAESIPVLFEDDWLLVVDKPAGVVVHGGSGHGAGLIEALKQVRGLADLRLAHRLDRDTSGVLLMAKNLEALRKLTEDFRERDMQKSYFALVAGHPIDHAGRMRSQLAKGVVRGGERMVVDAEDGKEAITDFQVMLERSTEGFDWAMLALNPHSGRTHQLRVQLQAEGHPILGDGKYAEKDELTAYKSMGGRGLMLHAWRLRLLHPVKGTKMEFKAPLPGNWFEVLKG